MRGRDMVIRLRRPMFAAMLVAVATLLPCAAYAHESKEVLLAAQYFDVAGGAPPRQAWGLELDFDDGANGTCIFGCSQVQPLDESDIDVTIDTTTAPNFGDILELFREGRLILWYHVQTSDGIQRATGGSLSPGLLPAAPQEVTSIRLHMRLTTDDPGNPAALAVTGFVELWGLNPVPIGVCDRAQFSATLFVRSTDRSVTFDRDRESTTVSGAVNFDFAALRAGHKRVFGIHQFDFGSGNTITVLDDYVFATMRPDGARRMNGFGFIGSGTGTFAYSSGTFRIQSEDNLGLQLPPEQRKVTFTMEGMLCEGGR